MNLRLDRLATLYLFSPLTRGASVQELNIPVLMYHSVANEDESRVHAYYRTSTAPEVFAAQMEFLHGNGYTTCGPSQALDFLQTGSQIGARPVVITFDDGYRDFYRNAFPVLKQFGFNATVFLPTAYIGDHPLSFKGKECMTWEEVRESNRHGMLFGSHTVTHPQLRDLSVGAVNEEIVNSRKTIENQLGCAIDSFAYPYAFPQTDSEFKKTLRDSLVGAGYKSGVCTTVGIANQQSDPLFMERLPVNSWDDPDLFRAKLAGAYNWIGKTQNIVKMTKAWVGRQSG